MVFEKIRSKTKKTIETARGITAILSSSNANVSESSQLNPKIRFAAQQLRIAILYQRQIWRNLPKSKAELKMVFEKVWGVTKWTAETVRGATVTLVSPNAPIPDSQLHPRMPARPWTAAEWLRMASWRHMWQYLPVMRYYVFSGFILYGVYKFVLPIKPHHKVLYKKGKEDAHHHEVEHWYGIRQKNQDREYFKKYDPLRQAGGADVGHLH